MKFTLPYSRFQELETGDYTPPLSQFPAEAQKSLVMAKNMIVHGAVKRHIGGDGVFTFYPTLAGAVTLDLCKACIALGGTVADIPFYAVIPDVSAELPAIFSPKTIIEYTEIDGENVESGSHVETWAEREERWHLNLGADENGKGHWPLMLARQPEGDRPAVTLQQCLGAGLEVVETLPVVEEDIL